MPWTEEQKRIGRVELQRRRTTETPQSRRATFIKAGFAAAGALIQSLLLVWCAVQSSTTLIRLESVFLALITTTLLLFAAGLAYVRFLDWRRGAKNDGINLNASKVS